MEWESIDEQTERAKVPGGWFVKFFDSQIVAERGGDLRAEAVPLSVVFYPDAKHSWNPTLDQSRSRKRDSG
jgi:hypothetical protein